MVSPVSSLTVRSGPPGLDGRRLVRLMAAAIERCQLDLAGQVVLTEAASGAYAVTPVLAALAGAQVYALAGATRYATAPELAAGTAELTDRATGSTVHIPLDDLPKHVREAVAQAIGSKSLGISHGADGEVAAQAGEA